MPQTHTQTKLQKNESFQTAWIPTQYAEVGNHVKLRVKGEWNNGWKIIETGTVMESAEVNDRTQDYKNMKKATDI